MGNDKPKWLPLGKVKTVRGYIEVAVADARERLATLKEAIPKLRVEGTDRGGQAAEGVQLLF